MNATPHPRNDLLTALLRQQTGEDSVDDRARISAEQRAAGELSAALNELQSLARDALEREAPGAMVLAQIQQAAAAACAEGPPRGRILYLPTIWRVATAAAAALALMVGVWAWREPAKSATPSDAGAAQLHALLALVDTSVDWEAGEGPQAGADLATLAEHLMVMQGLSPDESMQMPEEADPAPLPTTSRYRSTLGLPARIYG